MGHVFVPAIRASAHSCAGDHRQTYLLHKQKGCSYVLCQWNDGLDGSMLRSSRLVLISKRNGKILSDGSAGDKG